MIRNFAFHTMASIAIMSILALSACGGGGGAPAQGVTQNSQQAGQGTVKMFITDAETDRFNQILVTITKITLIAADGTQQVVSTDTTTVDLRKITDFSQFLAQNGVQPGTYSKIRLDVSSIVLNQIDSNGNIVDTQTVTLPSGKIDLNPQQPLSIAEGGQHTIEMDFDASNSFKMTTTGNGKVIFRPVVFIHELGEQKSQPGRLVREHGAITAPDLQSDTFKLCSIDHQEMNECLNVTFSDTTAMFDSTLAAIGPDGLVENTEITVFGYLVKDANGSHIEASLLVLGPDGTLTTAGGLVSTAPDSNGLMTVNLKVGSDVPAGDTSVQLLPGAKIVSRSTGDTLATTDLVPGTPVLVIGQYDSGTSVFSSVAISVADHGTEFEGTVTAINPDSTTGDTTLTIDSGSGTQCIHITSSTRIAMRHDSEEDVVNGGTATNIAIGQQVSARGTTGSDGCLTADALVAVGS